MRPMGFSTGALAFGDFVLETPVTASGMIAEIAVAQLALATTPTDVFSVG
jgi:hypothetical protein